MIPFDQLCVWKQTLTPSSAVSGSNAAEFTFTVPGLLTTDVIINVSRPSTSDALTIDNYRVSATSVMALTFANNTTASITAISSQSYTITALRLGDASNKTLTVPVFNRM